MSFQAKYRDQCSGCDEPIHEGRPFQTDVIRALCGACQRAQEVAG